MSLRRLCGTAAALALGLMLAAPAYAAAASESSPSVEFETDPYVEGCEIGPLDMSMNKAVVYLLIAATICIGVGLFVIAGASSQDAADARAERRRAQPTSSPSSRSRARRWASRRSS